jgi:hypothetical protein
VLKSYGYLKYDPINQSTRTDSWWAILKCNKDLVNYYRQMIEKEATKVVPSYALFGQSGVINDGYWKVTRRGVKIQGSAWGAHVSVIRGESPKNKNLWGSFENERIEFTYNPEYIDTNGVHWWIRVKSERLEEIRVQLGLGSCPRSVRCGTRAPLHITIGRDIEAEPRERKFIIPVIKRRRIKQDV